MAQVCRKLRSVIDVTQVELMASSWERCVYWTRNLNHFYFAERRSQFIYALGSSPRPFPTGTVAASREEENVFALSLVTNVFFSSLGGTGTSGSSHPPQGLGKSGIMGVACARLTWFLSSRAERIEWVDSHMAVHLALSNPGATIPPI